MLKEACTVLPPCFLSKELHSSVWALTCILPCCHPSPHCEKNSPTRKASTTSVHSAFAVPCAVFIFHIYAFFLWFLFCFVLFLNKWNQTTFRLHFSKFTPLQEHIILVTCRGKLCCSLPMTSQPVKEKRTYHPKMCCSVTCTAFLFLKNCW
jgi:hypothetical protein